MKTANLLTEISPTLHWSNYFFIGKLSDATTKFPDDRHLKPSLGPASGNEINQVIHFETLSDNHSLPFS